MTTDDQRGPMMTSDELAKLLAVSRTTVERMRYEGRGPKPIRLGRNTVRYDRSDVERWIATH